MYRSHDAERDEMVDSYHSSRYVFVPTLRNLNRYTRDPVLKRVLPIDCRSQSWSSRKDDSQAIPRRCSRRFQHLLRHQARVLAALGSRFSSHSRREFSSSIFSSYRAIAETSDRMRRIRQSYRIVPSSPCFATA